MLRLWTKPGPGERVEQGFRIAIVHLEIGISRFNNDSMVGLAC